MEKRSIYSTIAIILIAIIIVTGYSLFNFHSNPQIIHCDEIKNNYLFDENINSSINSDQEAFEALKTYWTVYNPNQFHLSIGISSKMTVEEALEGILRKEINIQTNEGLIEGVWMLYNLKAIDQEGNVYSCELISSNNLTGQFCDENGCVPLEDSKVLA